MKFLRHWIALFSLSFLASTTCFATGSNYSFKLVDYPGAVSTRLWGINNLGIAVGQADNADGSYVNFTYDTKNGSFKLLPNAPGAANTVFFAMNDLGVVVGTQDDTVTESVVILDKGKFTRLTNPGRFDWPFGRDRLLA